MSDMPVQTPEDAVYPHLITMDEEALSAREQALLEVDRRFAEKRGTQIMDPGSGMGEYIIEVKELDDGRVQVFTDLKVVRTTTRRFTLRRAGAGWRIEACEEPCALCHGTGRCHICGQSGHPGDCHCCQGAGFHRGWKLFIFPVKRDCAFCEGTGECYACNDGACSHCGGRGWSPSVSFANRQPGA
jgi:hypothetical protein